MNTGATVCVKKGGFLSAVATGFFGLLISAVVCGTGLGFYGLYLVDHNAGRLLSMAQGVIDVLPEWRDRLPPVLSDALSDTREPAYRDELEISCTVERPAGTREEPVAVIEVKNNGQKVVSMLAARVVLKDKSGVPVREVSTRIVTPLQIDDTDWRGPLQPSETRIARVALDEEHAGATPVLEITELRVFTPTQDGASTGQIKTAAP